LAVSRFPAIPDFSGDIESLGPVLRAMKDSLEELTAQRQGASLGAPMMFVQEPMPRQDATTRLRYGDLWINSHTQATHYWNDIEWVLTTPEATPFPDTVTNALNLLRSVIAGDGLSGGGELTADRTLNVDATVVRTTRTLTAGSGLTGGGDLSANRSFSIPTAGVVRSMLEAPTLGDSIRVRADAEQSSTSTSNTTAFNICIVRGGDVRVTFDFKAAGTATAEIQVNGTTVSTQTTSSGSYVTRTVDLTGVPNGGRISVLFRHSTTLSSCEIRNIRVRTDGEMVLAVPMRANLSDMG
jgi:hypothetical protein